MTCNILIWRSSHRRQDFSQTSINDFDLDITKLMNNILFAHQMLLLQFPTNYFKAEELAGGCRHKGCFVGMRRNTGDILSHALWLCLSSLQTPETHLICYKTDQTTMYGQEEEGV